MSKFLVNKTIKDIKIAEDRKAILFICDDGEHVAKADGDCCSNTWIENIEVPKFPCKVIDVQDLDLDVEDNDDYDVTKFYGCKIITDQGTIDIDYRNESNGYYGGNLVWPDNDYFYGGVFGQNVSNEEWKDLK